MNEAFNTLMAEVELISNSKPVAPVVIDPESDEPITPNHFLPLSSKANLPPGMFDENDSYAKKSVGTDSIPVASILVYVVKTVSS